MRRWSKWWGVVACVLVAGIVALPAPARAWQAFAKVTTTTGATIAGDSTVKGFEKQIVVLGLGNGLDFPVSYDPDGGATVGRLQLGPLHVVKAFDIATPKLVTAVVGNTLLTVEITIFKTTATGASVPGFKLTLTGAILTKMETIYDLGAQPSAMEKIEFVYRKLVWTDLTTGLTGSTP